ncbi:MAG: thioredoxin [Flavobacteriales bacterium]|nr:thioredoxin [Flavobacteriales bacterium]
MPEVSFSELIKGNKPVLVDFFAEWCGPCKMMKPILEELKQKIGEEAHVLKVDVDRNQPLAAALNIRSVPTLAIFKNGHIVWRKSGVMDADQLAGIIQQYK